MFALRSLLIRPCAGNAILGAVCAPTLLGGASFPAINILTQRWKHRVRKPIGSPRSRKKKYYVRVPTPRIAEEMSELYWRYSHYRTETRSLRNHFVEWKLTHYPLDIVGVSSAAAKDEPQHVSDGDFEQALHKNDLENKKVAEAREVRRMRELALREDERLEVLNEYDTQQAYELAIREEQVRRKKEVVARMVTPENLEERISSAYDNPVDYNFCINLAGKRVYGRPDPLNRTNMAFIVREERGLLPSQDDLTDSNSTDQREAANR